MGYNLPKDHCPALTAESLQRDAEHLIVEVAADYFDGITVHKLICCGLEKYHKFIDLIVGMCVNHPDFEAPKF